MEQFQPEAGTARQLRRALRYVQSTPELWTTTVMLAVMGLFVYEFEVVLPLFARETFSADADILGTMFGALGVGAVGGGLYTAARGDCSSRDLIRLALLVGSAFVGTAVAPYLGLALGTLVAVGATTGSFLAVGNALLQINSTPQMRGRVMAMRSIAFLGARPIGAPIVGWVCETFGPRMGLALGAVGAFSVAVWAKTQLDISGTLLR